jgi:sn-glycerol 3-phosphate transport system substrate-binding protein
MNPISRQRVAVLATAVLLVACTDGASSSGTEPKAPASTAPATSDEGSDEPEELADLVELELLGSTYQPCRLPSGAEPIVVWASVEPLFDDGLKALFAAFTESTGIAVELVDKEGEYEILQELASTPPEEWPDAVFAHEVVGRAMVDSERVVPPAECDPDVAQRLMPVAVSANMVDGQLASTPLWMTVPLLFLDGKKVAAAGLDLTAPPESLEQLMEWSQTLASSGASTHGLAFTDACGALVADHLLPATGDVLIQPDNGRSERGQRVAISEEQLQQLAGDLELLKSSVEAGHAVYISPDPGFSELLAISDSATDAAMAVYSSAAVEPVLDAVDDEYQDIDVVLLPIPGGGPVGTTSLWMLSSPDPETPTAAWPLADWLSTGENLAGWSAVTGLVSPVLGTDDSDVLQEAWAAEPRLRAAYEAIAAVPDAPSSNSIVVGPWLQIMSLRSQLCSSVMSGQLESEAAVRVFLDDVNNVIDAYEMARVGAAPPAASTTLQLTISCDNGVDVAGVWIQAATSASGFATADADGTYEYTLDSGGPFSAHVGCGDVDGQWASTEWSPILLGVRGELSCSGNPTVVPGRCTLK